ncbi:MAG: glycosyltransferase [Shewanella sp.]
MKMKASVIISFYNKTALLKVILEALRPQYKGNFDVIIADDGSNKDSKSFIENLIDDYPFKITHVWHEDKGFRKNKILNKSIPLANDYIIFIDGDCIPQSHFISDHLDNAQIGYCLNGRRVDLPKNISLNIFKEKPESFFSRNIFNITLESFFGTGKNIEKGIRITNPLISSFLNRKEKGIVGCNFSLFKDELIKINGFDERYEAPGIGEDSDIQFRLEGIGVKIKNIFYKANQVHIYHEELKRDSVNQSILDETIKKRKYITDYGITNRHKSEGIQP